jgi:hypothetical protein
VKDARGLRHGTCRKVGPCSFRRRSLRRAPDKGAPGYAHVGAGGAGWTRDKEAMDSAGGTAPSSELGAAAGETTRAAQFLERAFERLASVCPEDCELLTRSHGLEHLRRLVVAPARITRTAGAGSVSLGALRRSRVRLERALVYELRLAYPDARTFEVQRRTLMQRLHETYPMLVSQLDG